MPNRLLILTEIPGNEGSSIVGFSSLKSFSLTLEFQCLSPIIRERSARFTATNSPQSIEKVEPIPFATTRIRRRRAAGEQERNDRARHRGNPPQRPRVTVSSQDRPRVSSWLENLYPS